MSLPAIRQRLSHGMHLRESGVGKAGTLVYVHGLGESGLGFEALLGEPRLASYRHVAPDMPGYGKSVWRAEPLALADLAAHLAAWLADEVPDGAIVVGHSMGGVIGSMLCELRPDLVRGFVNVEGNISLGDCGYSSRAAEHTLESFLCEGYERLLAATYRVGVDDAAHRLYYPSLRLSDPRAFHRNSLELVELSGAEGLAGQMAALDVNGIYLGGYPDGTNDRTRELLDEAGVRRQDLDDSGHWPFVDQHDAFVGELETFLGD